MSNNYFATVYKKPSLYICMPSFMAYCHIKIRNVYFKKFNSIKQTDFFCFFYFVC